MHKPEVYYPSEESVFKKGDKFTPICAEYGFKPFLVYGFKRFKGEGEEVILQDEREYVIKQGKVINISRPCNDLEKFISVLFTTYRPSNNMSEYDQIITIRNESSACALYINTDTRQYTGTGSVEYSNGVTWDARYNNNDVVKEKLQAEAKNLVFEVKSIDDSIKGIRNTLERNLLARELCQYKIKRIKEAIDTGKYKTGIKLKLNLKYYVYLDMDNKGIFEILDSKISGSENSVEYTSHMSMKTTLMKLKDFYKRPFEWSIGTHMCKTRKFTLRFEQAIPHPHVDSVGILCRGDFPMLLVYTGVLKEEDISLLLSNINRGSMYHSPEELYRDYVFSKCEFVDRGYCLQDRCEVNKKGLCNILTVINQGSDT